MTHQPEIPLDEWGGNPPQEIARQPPKPWRTLVTYIDVDTGEIIISTALFQYWTPFQKEIITYEQRKYNVREIQWLCKRKRQYELFSGPAQGS